MEYFLIREKNIKENRVFKNAKLLNYKEIFSDNDKNYLNAQEYEFISVKDEFKLKLYQDIYTQEFPMISQKFYDIFKEFFEEKLKTKKIIVNDNLIATQYKYYYPILDRVDCLSDETKLNSFDEDISVNRLHNLEFNMVNEIILDESKMRNIKNEAFYIENFKKDILVVNLYIAELLLRNQIIGLELKRLQIK